MALDAATANRIIQNLISTTPTAQLPATINMLTESGFTHVEISRAVIEHKPLDDRRDDIGAAINQAGGKWPLVIKVKDGEKPAVVTPPDPPYGTAVNGALPSDADLVSKHNYSPGDSKLTGSVGPEPSWMVVVAGSNAPTGYVSAGSIAETPVKLKK